MKQKLLASFSLSIMSEFFKKKPVKKVESKVETRFYDELFKRLQDGESDEFKDPESVGNADFS